MNVINNISWEINFFIKGTFKKNKNFYVYIKILATTWACFIKKISVIENTNINWFHILEFFLKQLLKQEKSKTLGFKKTYFFFFIWNTCVIKFSILTAEKRIWFDPENSTFFSQEIFFPYGFHILILPELVIFLTLDKKYWLLINEVNFFHRTYADYFILLFILLFFYQYFC